MVERQTVQVSITRLARHFVVPALVLAGALMLTASPAFAVDPPEIFFSSTACSDSNGGALRPADDVYCSFSVTTLPDTENAILTATAVLPASLGAPTAGTYSSYDSDTRTITFDVTKLGFTFSGSARQGDFHVPVAEVAAGTTIDPQIDLVMEGTADHALVERTLTLASPLVVDPPPPDLSGSSVACTDVDGGQHLPGDEVSCDLTVANAADHEAAAGVTGSLSVLGTTWMSGGTQLGAAAVFGTSDIGTLGAGASKLVNGHFLIPPAALGGAVLAPSGSVSGSGAKSGFLTQLVSGASLVVDPGPADISQSSLGCADSNAGLVLPGDDLRCTLTVRAAAGHQGVSAAVATVPIPVNTDPGTGPDQLADGVLTFDASLGDVDAGVPKSVEFHLRVRPGTDAGSAILPKGALRATSVPAGSEVSVNLVAFPLVVAEAPFVPASGAPPADAASDPAPAVPPATPATVAKGYKLNAKTIRIIMRRGRRRVVVDVRNKVTRTPKGVGRVARKLRIPKKGKNAPKRGRVTVRGTKFTYILKKGKSPKDRFRYTVTDAAGKTVTGTVTVRPKKTKKP